MVLCSIPYLSHVMQIRVLDICRCHTKITRLPILLLVYVVSVRPKEELADNPSFHKTMRKIFKDAFLQHTTQLSLYDRSPASGT